MSVPLALSAPISGYQNRLKNDVSQGDRKTKLYRDPLRHQAPEMPHCIIETSVFLQVRAMGMNAQK